MVGPLLNEAWNISELAMSEVGTGAEKPPPREKKTEKFP